MLAEQRFEAIMKELTDNRAASVARLCDVTGASEATIRRDLTTLAQEGRLLKVHGGAVLCEEEFHGEEQDVATKRRLYTQEKACVARYAASLVADDDIVYLDAGTTVIETTEFLKDSKALFLTNGVECACRLTEQGLRAYVLGGFLKPVTAAIVGAQALEGLRHYYFTKAFLGANGITIHQGFTTPDPEEAAVKALAAQRAHTVYVLADASKFGKVTAAFMFPLETACVITNKLPDPTYQEYTEIREV